MREKVISILNRSDVAEEEKAAAIAREGAAKAAELAATSAVSASSMPSLTSEEEQELDEETLKERQVMAEIEKFRARQALRDKEAEELKRERVKERLKTLRENQARMAAVAIEETAKAEAQLQFEVGEKRKADEAAALAVNHGQDHQNKLRRNEGVDEEELKRRRKEQVAALVSSEALEEDFSRRTMKVGLKLTVPSKANVKMAVPASSMWSANAEEEAKPLRLMVPINYGDLEPSEKEGGGESEEAKRKKKQLELVDQIPTDKNILFAYKIDWSTVQSLQLAETSLRPWIVKKMVEYLGQEEKTLVDFIVAKIHNRCAPTELLKELDAVLDEDAEQFVVKLWRMLIFSIIASVNN